MGVVAAYPAISAMVAATAVSAYSAYSSGQQQKAMADYQADQAAADANAQQAASRVQAERIRRMAAAQAGSANTALAASGVEVGEGTALRITEDIYREAEEDAAMTIINGSNAAARTRQQGVAARIQGNQSAQAGVLGAGTSLLAGASSAYTGWKRSQATKG